LARRFDGSVSKELEIQVSGSPTVRRILAVLESPVGKPLLESVVPRVDVVIESAEAEELLSSHDAAEFLGINYQALIKRASRGTLPSEKRGRRYYFRRSELERIKR
jgi:hypothetical protein